MLDTRFASIVYQSQVYVSALVDQLVQAKKKFGKSREDDWRKADLIISYLEALQEEPKLTDSNDITNITFILECLCILCNISSFPTAPTLLWTGAPNILYGIPGTPGATGPQGLQGPAGLATDFSGTNITSSSVVDTFTISSAKAVRWDYFASNGTAQRASSILAHWKADGSIEEFTDMGTDDIGGSTSGLEFNVTYSGGFIQLVAVATTGNWSVVGTRYFIPNNGNGSGPISGVLSNGQIYIGNASDQATGQTMSGAATITNLGVITLSPGIIVNSNISVSAAIDLSKLAALSINRLAITNGAGILTTLASPTLTEVGYLAGVTSSIQTQLNSKQGDPMTTIGDIIIRNGSNVTSRLGIGSPNQVLTVSGGIPSWQTPASGFADPMTTIGDIIIRNGGNVTSRLGIGTANQVLTVIGGVPTWQNAAAGFADPMSSIGDMIFRNGSNVTSRIGIGTTGQLLTVLGGLPVWSTPTITTSGTYTPSGSAIINVSGITTYQCQWLQVGSTVTVSGKVSLVAGGGIGIAQFTLSLPVSSTLAAEENIGGTFAGKDFLNATFSGSIAGYLSTNSAIFTFNSTSTQSKDSFFTFTYTVI